MNIKWLGHASFKIIGKETIYIDPFGIKEEEKADYILITHGHYDHCSVEDVKKLAKEGTIIFLTADCQSKLSEIEKAKFVLVEPGKEYDEGIKIETIAAYNINKQFHPRENNWVGYIITIEGKRVYHAGDTDFTPEMRNLQEIDMALMPIGGTYTMNIEEAAEAVNTFKPKEVVPMHYGTIEGTNADVEEFKRKVSKGIKVKTL